MKGKWKNLRDKFRKKLKKIPKSRSGDDGDNANRYPGSWCHFKAMLFLQSTFTPRSTQGNIAELHSFETAESHPAENRSEETQSPSIEENDSQHTSPDHVSQSQLGDLQNQFATLPDVDGPIDPIEVPRKKRKNCKTSESNFEQKLLHLEEQKLKALATTDDNDNDDLIFFKSLLPHTKLLPLVNRLRFRSKVQNLLAEELSKLPVADDLPPGLI